MGLKYTWQVSLQSVHIFRLNQEFIKDIDVFF